MTFGAIHTTLGKLLRDRADRYGAKTFIVCQGSDYSYAFADAHANRIANQLAALAGVEKGTHVALLLGNCPEFVWSVLGLARLGAVAVPINTAAKGELLHYFLKHSRARVLIVEHELYERVAPWLDRLECLERIVVVGAPKGEALPENTIDFRQLETGEERDPGVEIHHRDPMFLMYTSGTTGPSKGAVSPHSQGISIGDQLVNVYGYEPGDILYTCLPLFHGNALWYSFMPALVSGATLVISRRFSGTGFWDEVTECEATQANLLGAMANIVIKELGRLDRPRLRLRQCMVVPALDAKAAEPFTQDLGIKLTSLYAQTETFAVTLYGPDEPIEKLGSAGRVYPYVDVAIMDDEDNRLAVGEVGEIVVRPTYPGTMMTAYYDMPEATLEAMSTMWFHSGDRGYLDADGYLFFVDRKKDSIRRRGENISAYELEMIISRHPAVREAAAVAVRSELGEDDVLVFIVAAPDAAVDFEDVTRFCYRNMPYFMVPRYLHVLDGLPKTSSEKIEKYKLREWAGQNMADLWDRDATDIALTR